MRATKKILADQQPVSDSRKLPGIRQSDVVCKNSVMAHLLGALTVQQLGGESSSGCRRPKSCCDHDGPGFPPDFCVSG